MDDTLLKEGMLVSTMHKERLDVLTPEEKILLEKSRKSKGITHEEMLKKLGL